MFLYGMAAAGKRKSRVHGFDLSFPGGMEKFFEEMFGKGRWTGHAGDIHSGSSGTIDKFILGGGRCDVIFLDAMHPMDHKLARYMVRDENSVVMYHWHFRNPGSKPYLLDEIKSGRFNERGCVKTWCTRGRERGSKVLMRESCFGTFPPASRSESELRSALKAL